MAGSEHGLQTSTVDQVRDWYVGDEPQVDDLHELWSRMRRECPVAKSDRFDGYHIVSTYAESLEILQDYRKFSTEATSVPDDHSGGDRVKFIPLNYDPPQHTYYRKLFASYFGPRAVAIAEPSARERFRGLLQNFVEGGGGDFIAQVALPYPCATFLVILGSPLEDLDQVASWNQQMNRGAASPDSSVRQYTNTVLQPQIINYWVDQLSRREQSASPPDDLLTTLSRAELHGIALTLPEKISTIMLFFAAGLDTVTGQMGFMMEALADDPALMEELVQYPSRIPNAVEEFLRHDSIVPLTRKATSDTEVRGCPIRAGDLVQMMIPSAGRDENQYANPDVLDFSRHGIKHLAFGAGPHRCLGSHLARMELRVALEEIVALMPKFSFTDRATVARHWGHIFGVDRLDLTPGGLNGTASH